MAGRTFLGTLRLALLLVVLAFVALGAWLDRARSRDWDAPLRVTVYPLVGSDDAGTQEYVRELQAEDFAAVPEFFAREAGRHGLPLRSPVQLRVSHAAAAPPPALGDERAGVLSIMAWSLRLRWYAARVAWDDPLPTPDVQVFAHYSPFDDGASPVPDSVGLSKGLVAVAHLYAGQEAAGSNQVVIAHELLHTLGATDKYAPGTGQPLVPDGLADPGQQPLYPQPRAEIMAGRIAVDADTAAVPASLRETVLGPATAREIGWTSP